MATESKGALEVTTGGQTVTVAVDEAARVHIRWGGRGGRGGDQEAEVGDGYAIVRHEGREASLTVGPDPFAFEAPLLPEAAA